MTGLPTLFHTVRHLRSRQLCAQVRHRLQKYSKVPARFLALDTPELPECVWKPVLDFLPPRALSDSSIQIENGEFAFLNHQRRLGWPPVWNPAGESKLWRYNLHYFDWLWSLTYPEARRVVVDWMEQCPLTRAQVAWEPYPTSLRVMNWCGFFWQRRRAELGRDAEFQKRLWRCLHQQMEWLTRHVEYHLLGNHLLENAAALAFVGSCFDGPDAARWFAKGESLLRDQLPEQILPDGTHFERSPMYHSRVVYLLLLLTATGNRRLQLLVQPHLASALQALAMTCHPDGEIALLNDSAFGIANQSAQILGYASAIGVAKTARDHVGTWSLPDAGYFGYRGDDGTYLICDAGAIGPDYIPGHAHGDIFSFELSVRNHRIIVDSGVFDYASSEMRRYCRSTAAHNTVGVDGDDQSEFWGIFRVARRARLREFNWEPCATGFRLRGRHDGYERLPARVSHSRQFTWHNEGMLMVRDEVNSGRAAEAVSRVHLHPDCQVSKVGMDLVELDSPAGVFALRFAGPGSLEIEETFYCPEFGLKVANQTLAWRARGTSLRFGYCFGPGRIEKFELNQGATVAGKGYRW